MSELCGIKRFILQYLLLERDGLSSSVLRKSLSEKSSLSDILSLHSADVSTTLDVLSGLHILTIPGVIVDEDRGDHAFFLSLLLFVFPLPLIRELLVAGLTPVCVAFVRAERVNAKKRNKIKWPFPVTLRDAHKHATGT